MCVSSSGENDIRRKCRAHDILLKENGDARRKKEEELGIEKKGNDKRSQCLGKSSSVNGAPSGPSITTLEQIYDT